MTWRNWSGTVAVDPVDVAVPRDVEEVAGVVRRAVEAGRQVTAVGSGHSFTPVAEARDVQLRLDRLTGIVAVEPGHVRVRAGTRLRELSGLLAHHGLALENLGDIDVQTVAGALSTGTHGTGAAFGGLAAQVVGLELVRGDGTVVRLGAGNGDRPPVAAAAVGLGALGVLTEVTLRCVPAFTLHAVEGTAPLGEVLEALPERVAAHDHYEFYWFPYADRCLTKANTRRAGPPERPLPRWRTVVEDEVLSNGAYTVLNEVGRLRPGWVPGLNRLAARALSGREYDDVSSRVFASPRRVRFLESEYAVPQEAVTSVVRELREWVERHRAAAVQFPVEVRFAAADDVWLSTAYGRRTAYVAVHQFHRSPAREYFRAFEAIALAHGGRPHWGKLHGLDAASLSARYPRMAEFRSLRDELDPGRVLTNRYVRRVLGA